MKPYIYPFMCL